MFRFTLITTIASAALAQDEEAVLRRARERQEQGDLTGALAVLDAAMDAGAAGPALWMTRASMRYRALSFVGALEDCNRGLAMLAPKGVTVEVGGDGARRNMISAGVALRGFVRSRLCDWPGAIEDLADAVALSPRDENLWRARAAAEHNAGRTADALSSLGKAIDLREPGAAECLLLRSQGHQLIGEIAAARADLDRAGELWAGQSLLARVELERIVLAAAGGGGVSARSACERVRAADPALAGWAALICWSLAKSSAREEAAKTLRDDFAAMPTEDPLLRELFALAADGAGDADGLTLVGRDSTAQCPLWYFGGCRSAQFGRDAEAHTRFLRCVNSGRPDYAQWRLALGRLRVAAGAQTLRPGLGLAVEVVRDAATPILRVTKVAIDGASAIQGLLRGDEIHSINGQPATAKAFAGVTKWLTFGTPVRFEFVRSGSATAKNVVAGVEP